MLTTTVPIDHQTWQGGEFSWRAAIAMVTKPFNQVVCLIKWQTKTLYLYYYNTYGHKLVKAVTYNEELHSKSYAILWGNVTH